MPFHHSLVVLRRDLRLQDNLALQAAIQQSQQVSVAFVLDERQIKDHPYRSDRGLAFMRNVLAELHQELGDLNSKAVGSGLLL